MMDIKKIIEEEYNRVTDLLNSNNKMNLAYSIHDLTDLSTHRIVLANKLHEMENKEERINSDFENQRRSAVLDGKVEVSPPLKGAIDNYYDSQKHTIKEINTSEGSCGCTSSYPGECGCYQCPTNTEKK